MAEWNIRSRAHACQTCGRAFKAQEALHTILYDDHQEYHRLDVCEACWQAEHAQGSNHRRGFISHWETRFEPPPATPPDPIQRESAESLLRSLLERPDPRHAGAVYVLAVMLERKRLLKPKATTTEADRRVLVYEHTGTGEVLTILDPALQLDQLEAVQHDVAVLMEHGLPPEPAAAPSTEIPPSPDASPASPAADAPVPGLPESGAPDEPPVDVPAGPTGEPTPGVTGDRPWPAAGPAAGTSPEAG